MSKLSPANVSGLATLLGLAIGHLIYLLINMFFGHRFVSPVDGPPFDPAMPLLTLAGAVVINGLTMLFVYGP